MGIPLKVNRNIWSNKRFEVYASAGGAVEKCVSGKRSIIGSVSTSNAGKDEQFSGGEENVKVKPLQWSLSAAAGAQFKITEKLGIYAEPGVVYYFDDGSNVNTIRKEHPLILIYSWVCGLLCRNKMNFSLFLYKIWLSLFCIKE